MALHNPALCVHSKQQHSELDYVYLRQSSPFQCLVCPHFSHRLRVSSPSQISSLPPPPCVRFPSRFHNSTTPSITLPPGLHPCIPAPPCFFASFRFLPFCLYPFPLLCSCPVQVPFNFLYLVPFVVSYQNSLHLSCNPFPSLFSCTT